MELSNNQIGRIQLTLAAVARLRSLLNRTGDIPREVAFDAVVEIVDHWWPNYSEIDGLASDLKTLYNYGLPFELFPRTTTVTLDGPQTDHQESPEDLKQFRLEKNIEFPDGPPKYEDERLHDADPNCLHQIVGTLSGVKCKKCNGWFTY